MLDVATIGLIVLLFIFIYLVYKGIKLLFRYLLIAGISAIFPIVAVKYLGFSFPLNLGTILVFVYLGVLGYTIYLCLSVIEKIGKPIIGVLSSKKKKEKELEKRIKKLEEENKEK
ncbi:MAG: hypothetical protein DRP10_00665 [Candidatus Aenigmatarchaeota archaeon]|nr:MAG: hypothetical protein DRP10_00665 [Candidatus Aenigmarchaeota archaeon]